MCGHFRDIPLMQNLDELGQAVAERRRSLGMTQLQVAAMAGVSSDTLSRFELGKVSEFGARKLLAVLSILGMEIDFKEEGSSGNLDELRMEHRAPRR
jgi:HTH-type transcriptional regulator / antitoxin HipB